MAWANSRIRSPVPIAANVDRHYSDPGRENPEGRPKALVLERRLRGNVADIFQLGSKLPVRLLKIVIVLQLQPEPLGCTERPGQPGSRISRDSPLSERKTYWTGTTALFVSRCAG